MIAKLHRQTSNEMSDRLLTTNEAASLLQCSAEHVRRMARKGLIPFRNIGTGNSKFFRFSESDIREAHKANTPIEQETKPISIPHEFLAKVNKRKSK